MLAVLARLTKAQSACNCDDPNGSALIVALYILNTLMCVHLILLALKLELCYSLSHTASVLFNLFTFGLLFECVIVVAIL